MVDSVKRALAFRLSRIFRRRVNIEGDRIALTFVFETMLHARGNDDDIGDMGERHEALHAIEHEAAAAAFRLQLDSFRPPVDGPPD